MPAPGPCHACLCFCPALKLSSAPPETLPGDVGLGGSRWGGAHMGFVEAGAAWGGRRVALWGQGCCCGGLQWGMWGCGGAGGGFWWCLWDLQWCTGRAVALVGLQGCLWGFLVVLWGRAAVLTRPCKGAWGGCSGAWGGYKGVRGGYKGARGVAGVQWGCRVGAAFILRAHPRCCGGGDSPTGQPLVGSQCLPHPQKKRGQGPRAPPAPPSPPPHTVRPVGVAVPPRRRCGAAASRPGPAPSGSAGPFRGGGAATGAPFGSSAPRGPPGLGHRR